MRVSLDLSPLHRFADTVYLLFVNSVQIDEGIDMKKELLIWTCASLFLVGLFSGCWGNSSSSGGQDALVVNTLEDAVYPATADTVTIRDAMERINPGGTITFDPSLDGRTIDLDIVGEEHSILQGEVFDPGFLGYQDRDYGASALYARKDLTIDASDLPGGITLNWTGGEVDPARVLAVYGDLTMANVNISSGVASAMFLTSTAGMQPYTLGRGGGVAVWGVARLSNCTISASMAKGDLAGGRDRGAFGGGIYGDALILDDCVVAGNSVSGYGAAGGGVYSVGGWDTSETSSLTRCAVTGNRIMGQHVYGGGVYSDGGGRGKTRPITLTSSTLARNEVVDHPGLDENPFAQYYYRGGGFYMSNGYLWMDGCTIAENVVNGIAATFSDKPNMGGGGVGATIGDAHVVEDMQIQQSIIAGNTVNGAPGDLFSGSLIYFKSWGYNLIGDLNFDWIHVPVPKWSIYMSRKHYPKEGDQDGVDVADVLSLGGAKLHPTIISVGVSNGDSTVLWYPPAGDALDTLPASGYTVPYVEAGWTISEPTGFLDDVLDEVELRYGEYSSVFGTQDLSTVTFDGCDAYTWPSDPLCQPWILFWRDLDAAMAASPWSTMGPEKLADDFWGQPFDSSNGPIISNKNSSVSLISIDQVGTSRPAGAMGDIGAIELP